MPYFYHALDFTTLDTQRMLLTLLALSRQPSFFLESSCIDLNVRSYSECFAITKAQTIFEILDEHP